MDSTYPPITVRGLRRSWVISAVIWRRDRLSRSRSELIWLKAAASSPSSSRDFTETCCLRLPFAMAWMAAVKSRSGWVSVRARMVPNPRASNAAPRAVYRSARLVRRRYWLSSGPSGGGLPITSTVPTCFPLTSTAVPCANFAWGTSVPDWYVPAGTSTFPLESASRKVMEAA